MARVRMVTRTISNTIITGKFLVEQDGIDSLVTKDINLGSIEGLSGKAISARILEATPAGHTFIKEISRREDSKVYGMPETEFLKYAKEVER